MPYSALKIRPAFASFDAERRFGLGYRLVAGNKACECGAILRGVKKPTDCKIFGTVCTPENPMGSCMVSSEIRYVELGPPDARVGCLSFDFYNGAMSTAQCERLLAALREARQRDTRVLVLLGGRDFFSNGIHLNCIEVAAHRSALLPELSAIPQFGYLVTSGLLIQPAFLGAARCATAV